eukprot:scaffold168635_cov18-Tisochrysis_lutea.AAC.2
MGKNCREESHRPHLETSGWGPREWHLLCGAPIAVNVGGPCQAVEGCVGVPRAAEQQHCPLVLNAAALKSDRLRDLQQEQEGRMHAGFCEGVRSEASQMHGAFRESFCVQEVRGKASQVHGGYRE